MLFTFMGDLNSPADSDGYRWWQVLVQDKSMVPWVRECLYQGAIAVCYYYPIDPSSAIGFSTLVAVADVEEESFGYGTRFAFRFRELDEENEITVNLKQPIPKLGS